MSEPFCRRISEDHTESQALLHCVHRQELRLRSLRGLFGLETPGLLNTDREAGSIGFKYVNENISQKALWDELWFVNMGYTNKIWLIDWLIEVVSFVCVAEFN